MRLLPLALTALSCLIGCDDDTAVCANGQRGPSCSTLEVCPQLTVNSRADIDSARNCSEIDGDLTLLGGTSEITASDFPNLTKVRGNLTVTSFSARDPKLTNLTLGALQTVGGTLQIANQSTLLTASFPALTTVGSPGAGSSLQVTFSALRLLSLPALTTVNGSVQLGPASQLCSANIRRVTRITGYATLSDLPNIPASALRGVVRAASGSSRSAVGCCYPNDSDACNANGAAPSCTTSACP